MRFAGKIIRGDVIIRAPSVQRSSPGVFDRAPMFYPLLRPLLFTLDPETAHDVAFAALDAAVASGAAQLTAPRVAASPVVAMGLEFPNRVGLAAGLDKNAAHIDGLATLGFGFIECGTVTPRPQPGNPKPRLFRLPSARALINRMGFNNHGAAEAASRLAKLTFRPRSEERRVGKECRSRWSA